MSEIFCESKSPIFGTRFNLWSYDLVCYCGAL